MSLRRVRTPPGDRTAPRRAPCGAPGTFRTRSQTGKDTLMRGGDPHTTPDRSAAEGNRRPAAARATPHQGPRERMSSLRITPSVPRCLRPHFSASVWCRDASTLTIDDDIAARIEERRRKDGQSLKQVVNQLLREGLRSSERPPEARPNRTKTRKLQRTARSVPWRLPPSRQLARTSPPAFSATVGAATSRPRQASKTAINHATAR